MGVKEVELKIRPTDHDAVMGCTGAVGPAPYLRDQPPVDACFVKNRTRDYKGYTIYTYI